MKKAFNLKSYLLCFISILITLTILCSCSLDVLFDSTAIGKEIGLLNVHFLDVGQGDSIFIELPDEKTMLIDSGENYHGEGIISYINNQGYSKIDYLVATHPHSDHIGSMAYIVRHMEIGSVFMPKVATNTSTYENLLESVSDKGLKIASAKSGLTIADEGDYSIKVVAPKTTDKKELNNCSAVIKLTYKDSSFLFTGDAEKKELETIKADIDCDVLKVGHHGSATSTYEEFLYEVNPNYAVISVGTDNKYNHPDSKTINLLEEFNCEIYRTDKDQTVVFSTKGDTISVVTGEQSIRKVK